MPSSSAVQYVFSVYSAAAFVFLLLSPALASESDHKYQADEQVTLWTRTVGPYNNPQETHNYYSLPFCYRAENYIETNALGEVLGGIELMHSLLDITFLKNVDRSLICQLELDDEAKVNHFKDAIENRYWFELYMDDLPMWGFVGNSENGKHVLYTHKDIIVKYNKDQIIHVNLTQDNNPRPLEAGKTVDFTYSVKWIPTNVTFAHRFDIYVGYSFFKHKIHWFSIFHMFMMVIFLAGLVSMIIMKTLRNDYRKYAQEEEDGVMERLVMSPQPHGPPCILVIISAAVGTGAQLVFLLLLVMLVTIVGTLYLGYVLHFSYDELLMG